MARACLPCTNAAWRRGKVGRFSSVPWAKPERQVLVGSSTCLYANYARRAKDYRTSYGKNGSEQKKFSTGSVAALPIVEAWRGVIFNPNPRPRNYVQPTKLGVIDPEGSNGARNRNGTLHQVANAPIRALACLFGQSPSPLDRPFLELGGVGAPTRLARLEWRPARPRDCQVLQALRRRKSGGDAHSSRGAWRERGQAQTRRRQLEVSWQAPLRSVYAAASRVDSARHRRLGREGTAGCAVGNKVQEKINKLGAQTRWPEPNVAERQASP